MMQVIEKRREKLAEVPRILQMQEDVFPSVYESYVIDRMQRSLPLMSPAKFLLWYNVHIID